MTEDFIEWYDTFNTKGCTYEHLLGNFHYQPIPPNYYDFPNDDNYNNDDIPVTTVDYVFPDNEGLEDVAMPNKTDT